MCATPCLVLAGMGNGNSRRGLALSCHCIMRQNLKESENSKCQPDLLLQVYLSVLEAKTVFYVIA